MSKRCEHCRQPLGKQYIRAENGLFHARCFACKVCQLPIQGDYRVKKGQLYHPACEKAQRQQRCQHCRQPLAQHWTLLDGKAYHPECYAAHYVVTCKQCGEAIEGSQTRTESGVYHSHCYLQHVAPRCDLCQQPLEGKYLVDLWGHKAHLQHAGQQTRQCHVCARILSENTSHGGVQYGDGRLVCGICRITEITEPQQIERAKTEVIAQLEAVGFAYLPKYIAVNLADQRTLNQRLGAAPHANSHGYTKTLEKRENGQLAYREHSIFILYGLPRLLFYGVLAHEMLHVWLNQRGLHQRSQAEVEGFCNLGTALIYQNEGSPLAQVLLQRLAEDPSPVYGVGYRSMQQKCQHMGWEALRHEMHQAPRLNPFSRFKDRWF